MVAHPTSQPLHRADHRLKSVTQAPGTTAFATQRARRSSRGNLNISPAKMRARRARIQCFSCEGQFSPSHVWPNAHLRVMIAAENQQEDLVANHEEVADMETLLANVKCQTMELHLYSTTGITRASTMKIQGILRKHPTVILIYHGAGCNFISADLVKRMGLTVISTKEFGVKLAMDI